MVSSVLAQAILSQRAPDIVGSFKAGREEARQEQVRTLTGEALRAGGGEPLQRLTELDPKIGLELGTAINARSAADTEQFIKDAGIGRNLLANNNTQGFLAFAQQRSNTLRQQGRDTSQTDRFISLVRTGNEQQALDELTAFTGALDQAAKIKASEFIPGRGFATLTTEGEVGFKELPEELQKSLAQEERQKIQDKLTLKTAGPVDLSAALEKRLINAVDDARVAETSAGELEGLASQFDTAVGTPSGAAGGFLESLKEFTGDQDALTLLRKKFAGIRSSQAVKNLPPGVASDKDIELALQGFLPPTANAETVAQWLRGAAKLEREKARFEDFRSAFISGGGSPDRAQREFEIEGITILKGDRLGDSFKRTISTVTETTESVAPQAAQQAQRRVIQVDF